MAIPTTTALKWSPSAANGISLTPNGTAWANSSWVEIIASTAAAIQIEQLVAASVANTPNEFEVDVGKGTAGSEVVVATIRSVAGSQTLGEWDQTFGIPVDNIPTSTRVAIRLRKNVTGTTAWTFALGYHEGMTSTQKTANASKAVPSAANGVTLTPSGTAWANSAYAEITTGIGSAILVTHLLHDMGVSVEFEYDISTGAAASEVVKTTLCGNMEGTGGMRFVRLRNPFEIAASTRIAVRLRKQGASVGGINVALMYTEKEAAAPSGPPAGSLMMLGVGV